jgi:hypothetical protein
MAAGEQLHRLLDLDVRRQDEDPGLGELVTDHARGLEPLGLVIGRHADVDYRHVGLMLTNQGEEAGRVAGLADDLEPGPLEQAQQPFAEQDVVVRERYSDRVRLHRVETIIRNAPATITT